MEQKNRLSLLNLQYAAIQIFYWCGACSILGFPMIFFHAKGFSYTQIGIIIAVVDLCSALIQPVYPKILQKFKKLTIRRLLLILFLIALLLTIALFFAPESYGIYLCFFVIFSITQSAASSLLNSFAMDFINSGIMVNYGRMRGFGSLAYGAISMLLGTLMAQHDENILLISNVICLILVMICIAFVRAPEYYGEVKSPSLQNNLGGEDLRPSPSLNIFLKKNPVFIPFLVATTVVFIGSNLMSTGYAPNYVQRFGGNSADAGTVMFVSAISEFLPAMFFVYLSKKFRMDKLLIFSAVGFILKSFGTAFAPTMSAFLGAQLFQGFGYGLFTVASVYFTNAIIPFGDRVLAQGLLYSVTAAGGMIAYLFGGSILDNMGIMGLSRVCLVFTILGGIMIILAAIKARKEIPEKLENPLK